MNTDPHAADEPPISQMDANGKSDLRTAQDLQGFEVAAMQGAYPHRELSAQIIGAAMNVINGLKPGLDEKVYENSLVLELIAGGHYVEQQRRFPVHYRGHLVGTLIPDLLVDQKVIVDPKVVVSFADDHVAQMLGYLAITDLELALLINFKFAKLQWKRVVRTRVVD